jgi:hypothetical protein
MKKKMIRPNRLISSDLHPLIYQAIVGLTLWLVVSVWVFFGGDYNELTFAVVSVFFLIVMAIPYLLWRVWRRDSGTTQDHESFREWVAGDFETWQGRQKSSNAAVEILLPIIAVAFGMTAFGIVLHFANMTPLS